MCAGFQVGLVPQGWVWDPELHQGLTFLPHAAFSARPLILLTATKNSGRDLPLPPRGLQDSSGRVRTCWDGTRLELSSEAAQERPVARKQSVRMQIHPVISSPAFLGVWLDSLPRALPSPCSASLRVVWVAFVCRSPPRDEPFS